MVGKDDVLLSFFYRVVDDISWKWTCSRFFWTQIIEDFGKDFFKEKKKKTKRKKKKEFIRKLTRRVVDRTRILKKNKNKNNNNTNKWKKKKP